MAAAGGGGAALPAGGDDRYVPPCAVPANISTAFFVPLVLAGFAVNFVIAGRFTTIAEYLNLALESESAEDYLRWDGDVADNLLFTVKPSCEAVQMMHSALTAGSNIYTLPSSIASVFKFFKVVWPPASANPAAAKSVLAADKAIADAIAAASNPDFAARVVGYGPGGVVLEENVGGALEADDQAAGRGGGGEVVDQVDQAAGRGGGRGRGRGHRGRGRGRRARVWRV